MSQVPEPIFAPTVVAIPPTNAHRDFMLLPDGELRHYGQEPILHADHTVSVRINMIRSFDNGRNWQFEYVDTPSPGGTVRSPWSGDYLTVFGFATLEDARHVLDHDSSYSARSLCDRPGLWLFRSRKGPDGPFTARFLGDEALHIQRQPLALRNRRRWILPFEIRKENVVDGGILYSDDDGEHWTRVWIKRPPVHEIAWPHKGYRWRHPGLEPVVAEYDDGRLHMLLRTSTDYHWECFSTDGGESWTDPAPSRFYSVATMPNLLALSGGRMLAIWNNTTPLPERDHDLQPELDETGRDGTWEDVFTNRDALHAAISDDGGRTWRGFRELALNACRNDIDFRSSGGTWDSLDKSIHQNQAFELADGNVIVAFGQHSRCRRIVIFNPRWLDETGREDDFTAGLDNWSIHQYLKSITGGFRGIAGHCSYNRRPGVALVPHPDGIPREVLQIARHPDPRLLHEKEGAVWNFPAARRGRLKLKLRLNPGSAGVRISLCDRWFNPVDPVIDSFAVFTLELDSAGRLARCPIFEPGVWGELILEYDQEAGICHFTVGEKTGSVPLNLDTVNGVSYLHLQSLADGSDPDGVFLESVSMTKLQ